MNKRVPHSILSAALSVPEEGVSRPARHKATSAFTQIAALAVGESWSRCEPVDSTMTMADYSDRSAALRDALRNSVGTSVARVKAKTEGTYRVETGDFISSERNLYLVCIVTRVA